MNEFMNKTQLPFLASPMGKGVVPDDSPLSVAAGRNAALSGCDVVFLVGARMNWIMHFGQPPRWAPDVKVIQLDIAAEEFGTSISTNGIDSNACRLCGDAKSVLGQLNDAVGDWSYPSGTEWWNTLLASVAKNVAFTEEAEKSDAVPMGYFRVFKELRDLLPRDAIIIAEGANTMDISRTSIPNFLPRKRLDAATFGTMGIGIGQLFAAGVVHPDQRIVAIEGDAAFGFSGMEMEAVIRYGLPVTCIVVNNNGIGGGSSRDPLEGGEENAAFEGGGADPTKWTPGNMGKETRYDLLVRPALTFGRTFSGKKSLPPSQLGVHGARWRRSAARRTWRRRRTSCAAPSSRRSSSASPPASTCSSTRVRARSRRSTPGSPALRSRLRLRSRPRLRTVLKSAARRRCE